MNLMPVSIVNVLLLLYVI